MIRLDMFDKDLQPVIERAGLIGDFEWDGDGGFGDALRIEGAAIIIQLLLEGGLYVKESLCDDILKALE